METPKLGSLTWVVPDGYLPEIPEGQSKGPTGYFSHESLCVLNTNDKGASLKLTIYFEDRPPVVIEKTIVEAQRSKHLHMEKLMLDGKAAIPRGCPYSVLVESNIPIIAQMTRVDTTQKNLALLTTMAYPIDS